MPRWLAMTGIAALGLALAGTIGCVQVRPWERELLAREDMAWQPDPLEGDIRSHIQFSKEGALVGGGSGGGGCGCN